DQVGLPKVDGLAENLRAVNPDAEVVVHRVRLTRESLPELFAGCDAVVEALDEPGAKAMVAEVFWNTGVLLVTASGMGGAGDADALVTRRLRDNVWLVGDERTACDDATPPFSPRVGIAAAMQANTVIALLLGVEP
ncbi:MAG: sulfur carrier protein ThiS adenylyltransferase ThiF, partial [Clostridia bacterium]|nr:sulfur carrier protein ThiS adenylyltransferase ThiF [Clostridia bacterium]